MEATISLVTALAIGVATALIPLIACIALEHFGPREHYSIKDRLPGIVMNGVSAGLSMALVIPLAGLWRAAGISPAVTIPLWQWLEPLGSVGAALQFLVLTVVADFLAYWRHRAEHRFFWPIHAVHHSPRELHAANSLGHPLQALFGIAFISIPMSLVQISGPEVPAALCGILVLLAYYIHSPIALNFGPLRKLIVDNRFHRIHHSLEERHFDKNFGICFSFWDYLFGTAYDPGEEWPSVGLADTPPPANLREFLMHPFVQSHAEEVAPPQDVADMQSRA